MRVAITRAVSQAIERCELTHLARSPIDFARAEQQHGAYEECLELLGCRVERLPAEQDLPDSVFVEDCAIVLDEVAVITRPGAASRRAETAGIEVALSAWRPIARIAAPATIDGGDVLRVGRILFVGLSARTTPSAVEQLTAVLDPLGYAVVAVEVSGCLHLKSAVTEAAPGILLVNPEWTGDWVRRFDRVEVAPGEPFAANGLLLGETLLYPSAFPVTRSRLEARGIHTCEVDVSELAKAEGAVTCCSLVFDVGR
jgi:dimethylargininase